MLSGFTRLEPFVYAVLRAVAGALFIFHGLQKLFGMFGGKEVELMSRLGAASVIELPLSVNALAPLRKLMVRKLVPANEASMPSTRSSSVGCPHDSWTWIATCEASRTMSISPDGHWGASRRATASRPPPSPQGWSSFIARPELVEGRAERSWFDKLTMSVAERVDRRCYHGKFPWPW